MQYKIQSAPDLAGRNTNRRKLDLIDAFIVYIISIYIQANAINYFINYELFIVKLKACLNNYITCKHLK